MASTTGTPDGTGLVTTTDAAGVLGTNKILLRWLIHVTKVRRHSPSRNSRLLDEAAMEVLRDYLRGHDPEGLFWTPPRRGTRKRPGKARAAV